ncbi:cytochrome c oxidase subunit II [Eisenibacter elegans]|jgi:cytochrome c oxidase subunit 2|uniref:cytochrome c oxidase subunit II n=1 Tax=Eisenibacter elegans TaxID=997 RepID=UPI000410A887|nr:cytochrome c oxidase subunit II transmembrane domain-containing protein [Eisenibacter elegans]
MVNIILGLTGVLILAIFLMLFRIQTLVSIVQGKEKVGMANRINAALMLIVPIIGYVLFAWYTSKTASDFMLPVASEHGMQTDSLFWICMVIILAMFFITNTALFVFAYRYQYQEGRQASFFHDNTQLEFIWTIIPAIILTGMVLYGNNVWWKIMTAPPKEANVLEIMGHQFAWKVRYPGKDQALGNYNFRLIDNVNEMGIDFEDKASEDDFMVGEIHIPVGEPVLFKIRARDVLHSVFAPHFRLKMDAVPGYPTQFHFVPTKTTAQMRTETGNPDFNYEIACTEICGRGHFAMKFIVVVEEKEEYEKWYAAQTPFLEQNPDYKGKGMSEYIKKNIAGKQAPAKELEAKPAANTEVAEQIVKAGI